MRVAASSADVAAIAGVAAGADGADARACAASRQRLSTAVPGVSVGNGAAGGEPTATGSPRCRATLPLNSASVPAYALFSLRMRLSALALSTVSSRRQPADRTFESHPTVRLHVRLARGVRGMMGNVAFCRPICSLPSPQG